VAAEAETSPTSLQAYQPPRILAPRGTIGRTMCRRDREARHPTRDRRRRISCTSIIPTLPTQPRATWRTLCSTGPPAASMCCTRPFCWRTSRASYFQCVRADSVSRVAAVMLRTGGGQSNAGKVKEATKGNTRKRPAHGAAGSGRQPLDMTTKGVAVLPNYIVLHVCRGLLFAVQQRMAGVTWYLQRWWHLLRRTTVLAVLLLPVWRQVSGARVAWLEVMALTTSHALCSQLHGSAVSVCLLSAAPAPVYRQSPV